MKIVGEVGAFKSVFEISDGTVFVYKNGKVPFMRTSEGIVSLMNGYHISFDTEDEDTSERKNFFEAPITVLSVELHII